MSTATAPIHGNYHGYYAKRSKIGDRRLALLSSEIFKGARVLDVGCNEGWVTCEIAQRWHADKVVGVDIDDMLIRAAWKRRRLVWSIQSPAAPSNNQAGTGGDSKGDEDIDPHYFPASFEHMFGALPNPPFQNHQVHTFPHNVSFRCADWVNGEIPEDLEGYDVVVAFSVTKWIHLNGGDNSLMRFFRRVFSVLKPGGVFILEVQLWDMYNKTRRLHPGLKQIYKTLKIRPDRFDEILQSIGFCPAERVGRPGENGFSRPIDLYRKV
ncbi:hypothetical protein JAAARDRAFT_56097 [Jaapia argillacea MUCL 33604]|uniref:RNA methyltransferase n=1 Tax=Jaapia argillacea MUCL 33604 TaxID=933084 RepID=A0A067Q1S9_9AGAM|nr:hypothetical protein JAAARDRAFT_56097 [Jaapia argillacea MUCL 33604]